jgi:protein-disulfide isomerase
VAGARTLSGVGFTVSLLIATLAFDGRHLEEAKLGVLTAAGGAAVVTGLLFAVTSMLPERLRQRALRGASAVIVDLVEPVVVGRDHIRGPRESPVTIVEYGDFECPYCGRAEPSVRALLADFGDVRYVWRQLPLRDVHPHAQLAAEASEAADAQGLFWPMHDRLLDNQDALAPTDLVGHAMALGLDIDHFMDDLRQHRHADRVAADVEGADLSAVTGTPTFFINGQRHTGAYDLAALTRAVNAARAQAELPPASARRAPVRLRSW